MFAHFYEVYSILLPHYKELIMFLSSKQVGLLATAFSEVQKTDTVKHGEELLI